MELGLPLATPTPSALAVVAQAFQPERPQTSALCALCSAPLGAEWKSPHYCKTCKTPQPIALSVETRPVDCFSVFGMKPAFSAEISVIEKRYFELSRLLHPDRYQTRRDALAYSLERQSLINDSLKTLKNESSRRAHVLELLGSDVKPKKIQPPLEIAEEWFEVQEGLLEGDRARVLSFRKMLLGKREEVKDELHRLEKTYDQTGDRSILVRLFELVDLNQYLESLERDLLSKLGTRE